MWDDDISARDIIRKEKEREPERQELERKANEAVGRLWDAFGGDSWDPWADD